MSDAGSDWRTWGVRLVGTGEELPDRVAWSKFSSAAWTHDDAGFFYGRYPEPMADAAYDAPNRDMELRYHRLGTDAAEDRLVFATPHEPEWGFEPEVSDDGRFLVLSVWRGTDPENRIYVADLASGVDAAVVRPLLDAADASYQPIGMIDGRLFLLTDRDAPLGRVIAVDVDDAEDVREIIPEGDDALERVCLVGNRLAAVYLHHAHHRLTIFEPDGRHVVDVSLPGIGTIVDMAGRRTDDELFLTFMSFAAPASVLAVRMADGAMREVQRPALAWDPADFVTEQVFVTSDDGTQVPLFLTRRRDVAPDGEVPTLLYGYGGFQIPIGPTFKAEWLTWLERGGLLAVASLRGGGEYGKAWHDAGRLANKQNVFDDFAACLRWLAASGWTRPGADRDQRTLQRGPAGGRDHHAASGAVRRCRRGGGGDGHAALPPVHHRLGLDQRLRLRGRPGAVPDAPRVLAAPQHPDRGGIPGDPGDHRRPRRPGRARPLLQVHGGAPGGAGRRCADRHPDRHRRGPRRRQAREQADRRACRRAGLPGAGAGTSREADASDSSRDRTARRGSPGRPVPVRVMLRPGRLAPASRVITPPEVPMRHPLASVVVVAVGAGLPISQLAIRRFGRPGAAGVAAVSAGILAMDLANLGTGRSHGNLRRLVRLEARGGWRGHASAGALLLLDPIVKEAVDDGWRVGRPEMLRRLALGLLFGVLSARLRFRAGETRGDRRQPDPGKLAR